MSTGSRGAVQCEHRITAAFPDDRLIKTRDQGDIVHWRRGLPTDGLVITVGGDGAWRESLQSAPKQVIPGLLSAGSLSQAGIELGQNANVDVWQYWRRTDIQLGHVEGYGAEGGHAAFFLMAGAGVEADAVARVRPWLKRRIGKWAYVWALIERLMKPVYKRIVVGMDGRHFRTSQVLVQNGAHYGGAYRVAATDVFTPGYRVLIWKYPGRCMWCLTMMFLMFGLPSAWLVHDMMAEQARIRGVGKMRCQLDGDMGPALPLRIRPTSVREIAVAGEGSKPYGTQNP